MSKSFYATFLALLCLIVLPAYGSAEVLLDQPLSSSNTYPYFSNVFVPSHPSDTFIADDFVNDDPWYISKIFIPGAFWLKRGTASTLANAALLNWRIYRDDSGKPDGQPGGGAVPASGSPPVWSLALSPAHGSITLSDSGTDITLDLAKTPNGVLRLDSGHYWLVFSPELDYSLYGGYGRQPSDTTNDGVAQFIEPGGGDPSLPTAWTSVLDIDWELMSLNPLDVPELTKQDFAFRLDGTADTSIKITPANPEAMASVGTVLYGDFGTTGIWRYNGTPGDWTKVTPANPEAMTGSSSALYADFGATGIWRYNGTPNNWTKITPANPEAMTGAGSDLFGDFGATGIWKYNGTPGDWTQITPANPEAMASVGTVLYGDFGTTGIWRYNGTPGDWTKVTPANPEAMTGSSSALYADFGATGIWRYNGTPNNWTQITIANPEAIAAAGSVIYGDFGATGIWRYDGTPNNWSQITLANPEAMTGSSSALYGDFGTEGIRIYTNEV